MMVHFNTHIHRWSVTEFPTIVHLKMGTPSISMCLYISTVTMAIAQPCIQVSARTYLCCVYECYLCESRYKSVYLHQRVVLYLCVCAFLLPHAVIQSLSTHATLQMYMHTCTHLLTVGEVDEDGLRLIKTARYSLDEAIKICKPGLPFNEIGSAIQYVHSVCFCVSVFMLIYFIFLCMRL